jgi:hypothetical protein
LTPLTPAGTQLLNEQRAAQVIAERDIAAVADREDANRHQRAAATQSAEALSPVSESGR